MNENATYKQLMLLPSDELTEPQKTFLAVHNEMVMAGQKAAECLLVMLCDMRRMRDEKLYTAAGFKSLIEYVETALNVKERQAYNWIRLLDLPEAYVEGNVGMGVTKLIAIASASEKVADELMNDESVSEKTVKELNEIIKAKEKELEEKEQQLRFSEKDLTNKEDEITRLENELIDMREKITAAEDAAAEIDTSEYEKKISKLTEERDRARNDLKIASDKLMTSEEKLKKLKSKKQEVKIETVEKTVEVENPETKNQLEQAQKDLSAAEQAKADAEEKAAKAEEALANYKKTQEAVAAFKIHAAGLFEAWDTVIDAVKQIKSAGGDYAEKCVAKLITFSDAVKSDIEELQK